MTFCLHGVPFFFAADKCHFVNKIMCRLTFKFDTLTILRSPMVHFVVWLVRFTPYQSSLIYIHSFGLTSMLHSLELHLRGGGQHNGKGKLGKVQVESGSDRLDMSDSTEYIL